MMHGKISDNPLQKRPSMVASIKRRLTWFKSVEPLQPFPLTDLAPMDDAHNDDKAKTYFRALRGALDNERVTNIAITGHYGCGKSSILRTYGKHYSDGHKFLNISLATFGQDNISNNKEAATQNGEAQVKKKPAVKDPLIKREAHKSDGEPCDAEEQRRSNYLVEHSILQQIIYQVPKSAIPRSRFKRIGRPASLWRMWLIFLFWGACLGAALVSCIVNKLIIFRLLPAFALPYLSWRGFPGRQLSMCIV